MGNIPFCNRPDESEINRDRYTPVREFEHYFLGPLRELERTYDHLHVYFKSIPLKHPLTDEDITYLRHRCTFSHPNVLKNFGFSHVAGDVIGLSSGKVYYYLETFQKTLIDEIISKRATRTRFTETELITARFYRKRGFNI